MEYFEIGSCFKTYDDLKEKLNNYCKVTNTNFFKKDSRFIDSNLKGRSGLLIYSEIKFNCIHSGLPPTKRESKNLRFDCPAYFRLKLVEPGAALQIVALNNKHNHPLGVKKLEKKSVNRKKVKIHDVDKENVKRIKVQVESENNNSSVDSEPIEFKDVLIDPEVKQNVNFTFRGLCAPVFNVFNQDLSVNVEVIPEYAKFLADNDLKAVLVHGSTGEGVSMSVAERKLITEEWARAVKTTKQHLMVQVGGCPLPDVLELAKHAEQIGADSILCLPELYFKPTNPTDLIDYLKIVGNAAPNTPLLYYHIPMWSGVNINMSQFLNESVGKIPTFHGIKYTSNDLDGGAAALRANNGKYAVFLGADTLLAGAFTLGFDSAIATTFNIIPQYGVKILNSIQESNVEEARELQNTLSEICSIITKNGAWVPTMKAAMNLITPINVGVVRPPLKNLQTEYINEMKNLLKAKSLL